VTRAREAAERAGAAVEWVCGDALQAPFPAGSFDLVLMQYPALRTREKAARTPATLVAGALGATASWSDTGCARRRGWER
jgi:hypothetical protein